MDGDSQSPEGGLERLTLAAGEKVRDSLKLGFTLGSEIEIVCLSGRDGKVIEVYKDKSIVSNVKIVEYCEIEGHKRRIEVHGNLGEQGADISGVLMFNEYGGKLCPLTPEEEAAYEAKVLNDFLEAEVDDEAIGRKMLELRRGGGGGIRLK